MAQLEAFHLSRMKYVLQLMSTEAQMLYATTHSLKSESDGKRETTMITFKQQERIFRVSIYCITIPINAYVGRHDPLENSRSHTKSATGRYCNGDTTKNVSTL